MRIVLQRVKRACVSVQNEIIGAIDLGLLLLFAVHKNDGKESINRLADKIAHLRIFEGEDGKMGLSIQDVRGGILVVSQFTLYGDCSHGRRPDFFDAASSEQAEPIYNAFVDALKQRIAHVETGRFGALMDIELTNHGPVTLVFDSI